MTSLVFDERHPVRQVLRARRERGSRVGRRDDPFKVGLAIEGGGMRGVVSAAMLTALEDLGYAPCFDEIYCCSSGAVNGAYFMTGTTWFPLSIYYDDLTTGEFLDFRRILRRQAPMDLTYVFSEVLTSRKPLDYEAIVASPQRLHVMVTDVDALKPLDIADFDSGDDLRSALLASTWLPLATKGTATFRGSRAIDGGVLQFHPFRAARTDGCTHILSLSTKPIGPLNSKISITNRVVARHLERLRRGLGEGFLSSVHQYVTEDRPHLASNRANSTSEPAVLDLAPLPGTPEVKRHEMNPLTLFNGARSAYRTTYLALEGKDVAVIPRLTAHSVELTRLTGEDS